MCEVSSIAELISALKHLEESGVVYPCDEIRILNNGDEEDWHEDVRAASALADELPSGTSIDRGAYRDLVDAGFKVKALEKDSFGWLVGGIFTRKGIVRFG